MLNLKVELKEDKDVDNSRKIFKEIKKKLDEMSDQYKDQSLELLKHKSYFENPIDNEAYFTVKVEVNRKHFDPGNDITRGLTDSVEKVVSENLHSNEVEECSLEEW